jgi:hypothetical protein
MMDRLRKKSNNPLPPHKKNLNKKQPKKTLNITFVIRCNGLSELILAKILSIA